MNLKQEKINIPICQTYSWNEGGLKLFRFREYRPLISFSSKINASNFRRFIFPVVETIFTEIARGHPWSSHSLYNVHAVNKQTNMSSF